MLLCLLKGKAPTWASARELLNPLTCQIELAMTDVSKLRPENVGRAQDWLTRHSALLSLVDLTAIHPPAARLLQWVLNVLTLYQYRFLKSAPCGSAFSGREPLPKLRKTAAAGFPGHESLKLTGTKKVVEPGSLRRGNEAATKTPLSRRIRSEDVSREPRRNLRLGSRAVRAVPEKRTASGRYVTGKTFALSQEFALRRAEIPLAILKGRGDQRALIMKSEADNKDKPSFNTQPSPRVGELLDKYVEQKSPA